MNARFVAGVVALATMMAAWLPWEAEAGRRTWMRDEGYREMRARDESRALFGKRNKKEESIKANKKEDKNKRSDKPNIIFIITDDQDVELGSLNFMPKTMKILRDGGAIFSNAFVTTPMCCPSRSSMLTGMYTHNHNVYTNNENCSSTQWRQNYETRNFGTYLTNAGYRTGYFGKYLNEYDGNHIPPGWVEWVGLIRNTRFYNYTLNFNGKKIKHMDNYHEDYLTDLIANDSVTFLKQSKQFFPNRPVAMVLSMPAPHGPEDAAPKYQQLFKNVTTHRTPSWNVAPNPDKQWILQYTGKMEPIHIAFTDILHQKRLQTLQSVDDAVEKLHDELQSLGELDNTYFVYSSDHGYHLGQYGIIKGKAFPYDFDVKVPFLVRGPKVPRGVRIQNIVLNVDIAPTFLDIAGIPVPEHMDGKSVLELFDEVDKPGTIVGGVMKRKKAWRDTFLIERGKITQKKMKIREKIEAQKNHLVMSKQARLVEECSKAEYQPPCKGSQQWTCHRNQAGKLRIFKCRYGKKAENEAYLPGKCNCPPPIKNRQRLQNDGYNRRNIGSQNGRRNSRMERKPADMTSAEQDHLNKKEKKRQRQFLKDHVNQPKMLKARFMKEKRLRRSVPEIVPASPVGHVEETSDDTSAMEENEKVDDLQAGVFDISEGDTGAYYGEEEQDVEDYVGLYDDTYTEPSPGRGEGAEGNAGEDDTSEEWWNDSEDDYDNDNHDSQVTHNDKPSATDARKETDDYDLVDVDMPLASLEQSRPGSPQAAPTPETFAFNGDVSYENEDELPVNCRTLPNNTVVCERDPYNSYSLWRSEKARLDQIIKEMKDKLDELKILKKNLHLLRPADVPSEYEQDSENDGANDDAERQDGFLHPTPLSQPDSTAGGISEDYYYSPDGSSSEDLFGEDDVAQLFEEFAEEPPEDLACNCDDMMMGDEPRRGGKRKRVVEERERKRRAKQHLRDLRRQQRQLEKEQKRLEKKMTENGQDTVDSYSQEVDSGTLDPTRDCNSERMKCFTHGNDHWKTPPYWDSLRGGGRRHAVGRRRDPLCDEEGMECTRMDNDHWKSEPKWRYGPFCFCPNSNNNTYWCVRTVNETHNFLYCEFITGFISYYDMTKDPYQLRNAVHDLSYDHLQEHHKTLEKLKVCRGARECTIRHRPPEAETKRPKKKKVPTATLR